MLDIITRNYLQGTTKPNPTTVLSLVLPLHQQIDKKSKLLLHFSSLE